MMPVEPISASLAIFASIMSIAASIKQLMQRHNVGKEEALQSYIKDANEQERALLEETEIQSAVLEITVISERMLKQLSQEAHGCENKHINDRKTADSQIDKDQADIDAAQCMCNVLRDLMRYNKKSLPQHGPFEDWWNSYSCSP